MQNILLATQLLRKYPTRWWDIDQSISQGNATEAQTLNTAFTATNVAENNTKTYNDIAIKVLNGQALNTSDSANLFNIANECPHTDGICVYQARILYNQIALQNGSDFVSFPDNCNPSGLYKTSPTQHIPETTQFDLLIYPNPTTDGFNVAIIKGVVNNINVVITDMLGKQVFTAKQDVANGSTYIYAKLAAGTYIVKFKNNNNETITKKLLVQ
jgi:hypothetical protein